MDPSPARNSPVVDAASSATVIEHAWQDQAQWSAVANQLRDGIAQWRTVAAVAGVLGVFFTVLASVLGGESQQTLRSVINTLGVLLLAVVPYVRQNLLAPEKVRTWTRARNVSELLKEAIYRHMMGSPSGSGGSQIAAPVADVLPVAAPADPPVEPAGAPTADPPAAESAAEPAAEPAAVPAAVPVAEPAAAQAVASASLPASAANASGPDIDPRHPMALVRRSRAIQQAATELAGLAAGVPVPPPKSPRPTVLTVDDYIRLRVQGQVTYYKGAGEKAGLSAQKLRRAELLLGALAVVLGVLSGQQPASAAPESALQGLAVLSALAPWVALVVTAGSAITAHLAATRYEELAHKYFSTQGLLKNIHDDWLVTDQREQPAQVQQFVDNIERAISTETGAWVSDWNKAQQG